jgi:hypothetical protein
VNSTDKIMMSSLAFPVPYASNSRSHTPAQIDAGNVSVRLGFPHRPEQAGAVEDRHHVAWALTSPQRSSEEPWSFHLGRSRRACMEPPWPRCRSCAWKFVIEEDRLLVARDLGYAEAMQRQRAGTGAICFAHQPFRVGGSRYERRGLEHCSS